jgi:hypothetical protein
VENRSRLVAMDRLHWGLSLPNQAHEKCVGFIMKKFWLALLAEQPMHLLYLNGLKANLKRIMVT